MGGKGEFISITKLKDATLEEKKRLQARIDNIINQTSMQIAIIAIDPDVHSGMRVILEPKEEKEPPKGS